MSVPDQLERDFGNPARFYKAMSLRLKSNPVFLPRQLRPRPHKKRNIPKFLRVELTGLYPSEPGYLTMSMILVNRDGNSLPDAVQIVNLKEIPKDGKAINLRFELSAASVGHDSGLVLVIAFHPKSSQKNLPKNGSSGVKSVLNNVLRDLLDGKSVKRKDMYICGMDIPAKFARLNVSAINKKDEKDDEGRVPVDFSVCRKWMSPVYGTQQKIVFKTQPRDASAQKSLPAKILIQWVYSKKSESELDRPLSNGSTKSGSEWDKSVSNGSVYHNGVNGGVDHNGVNGRVNHNGVNGGVDHNGVNGDFRSSKRTSEDSECDSLESNSGTENSQQGKTLIYHCMYTDPETESRNGKREFKKTLECLFCGAFFGSYCESAGSLNGRQREKTGFSCNPLNKSTRESVKLLLFHLKSCHFHFEYDAMKDEEGNLFIFVSRDRKEDLDGDDLLSEKTETHLWSNHCSELRKSFEIEDLPIIKLADLPLDDEAEESDEIIDENEAIMVRQYYHARSGMPLVDEEIDYESDQECSVWWELSQANKAVDEYEDIGFEEKSFMKLWNAHLVSCPPYGDSYLSVSCERFVRKFATQIVDQHLRYHFLFHLIALWDFGLLRSDEILMLMAVVDQRVTEKKEEEAAASGTDVKECTPSPKRTPKKATKLNSSTLIYSF